MNEPITDITAAVLTGEARSEFSIASVVTESPDKVRFRLDPGVAFAARSAGGDLPCVR